MFLLSAFCNSNADRGTYEIEYYESIATNTYRYLGYSTLVRLFIYSGINFQQYLVFIYAIICSLTVITIRKLTDNANFVLACYLIYPFAIDVVQIKYFLMNTIFLIAFFVLNRAFLFRGNKRKYMIALSIILQIISVSMHFSGFFYMLGFLFLFLFGKRKSMSKSIFISTVIVFFIVYCGLVPQILSFFSASGIIGEMYYLQQYASVKTRLGFIIPTLSVILIIFSTLCCNKYLTEHNSLLFKYILTVSFIIPLLVLNSQYDRLIRMYLILLYVFVANTQQINFENKIKIRTIYPYQHFYGYLYFWASIFYSYFTIIFPFYANTLGALLKNNMLLMSLF